MCVLSERQWGWIDPSRTGHIAEPFPVPAGRGGEMSRGLSRLYAECVGGHLNRRARRAARDDSPAWCAAGSAEHQTCKKQMEAIVAQVAASMGTRDRGGTEA